MGLVLAGAYRNREFFGDAVDFAASVEQAQQDLMFDPQTSEVCWRPFRHKR